MSKKYIDADALIKWIDYFTLDQDIKRHISDLPAADVRENVRGEWVYDEHGMDWNLGAWVCNKCHCRNDNIPPAVKFSGEYKRIANPNMWQGSHFCPNCGADMRGEEHG